MGIHFWRLLGTAWELLRNSLSTSNLSIIVFSICIPLAVFVTAVIAKWLRGDRSWGSFVTTVKGYLKPAVILSLCIEALAWCCLLSWAVYKSVYNDHQNLAGRLRAVVHEKDELKSGLSVRDGYIQQLTDENVRLRATRIPRASTSVPTVINAPGGIPIVGNQGTVTQPTVNNYGPLPRHLLDRTKKELTDCLKKKPGRFSVGALGGNSEAYKYAEDWRLVFTSAGWEIEHKDIPIQIFMIGGGMWSGMQVGVHDASPTQGQMAIAVGSPEQNASECLLSMNGEIPGGGSIIPYKDFPTGSVRVQVSDQPQK